ncbi:MAG: ribosomal-protein-alanine N-acetyltransferase [Clostridiales bacterium]|nr:ribosomal-protein-alanine N-acetyltransferase [Clostridiales bacterium]
MRNNKYIFELLKKDNINYEKYVKYISDNLSTKFESSWSIDEFNSVINLDNTYLILCFNNELIIGYICFSNLIDEMEILNISVNTEYRKKGIGYKLIELAFDFSKNNNCKTCMLEVNVNNTKAINLYTKLGFNNIHTRKGYYLNKKTNTKEDAYIMTKNL